MKEFLKKYRFILSEASVVERLRRSESVRLDPILANASLIYDDAGRRQMANIYEEYLKIADNASIPIVLMTPTWRTNIERVKKTGCRLSIHRDIVRFMKETIDASEASLVILGGMMGCKNDCYRPQETLSPEDAEAFHTWQAQELANAGVDMLIAQTLPAADEALGIAQAMANTKLDYVISFVIDMNGRVLDGTLLTDAMDRVDAAVSRKPLGYFVNCSFPTFVKPQLQGDRLRGSLIGIQANGSSLSVAELEGSTALNQEPIPTWGEAMLNLHRQWGVSVLGGCCGTSKEHLVYLVEHK